VRIYEKEPIPEKIIRQCLHNALHAPNSSNLQPWEFYHIVDPNIRQQMNKACLDQIAARTAATLFVAVARTNTWQQHAQEMVRDYEMFSKGIRDTEIAETFKLFAEETGMQARRLQAILDNLEGRK